MFKKSEYNKLLKVKGILEEIWDGKLSKYHLTVIRNCQGIQPDHKRECGGNNQ